MTKITVDGVERPIRVYVASSWRNDYQQIIVHTLRAAKLDVYDFRNPHNVSAFTKEGKAPRAGFHWSNINKDWQFWTNDELIWALNTELAEEGFSADWNAMDWADRFVLVMPCGRSAHLEAGWAAGAQRPLAILLEHGAKSEPELMYKMADYITDNLLDLLEWFGVED